MSGLRADLFERQIARLIAELKPSRELITTQRAHIQALEDRLAAELKNSTSLTLSYELAQRENATRQVAIDSLQQALQAKTETVAVLSEQRDKERRRTSKANKRAVLVSLGAAALTVLTFLK